MSKIYGSVSLVIISMVVPVYAQDSVEIEEEVVVSESESKEVVLDPSAPRSTRPACFSVRRIDSFSAFHDEYIYIQDVSVCVVLGILRYRTIRIAYVPIARQRFLTGGQGPVWKSVLYARLKR